MRISHCFLPLLLIVVMGCGDSRVKLPTSPVAGTVTYQGKPLGTGRVVFVHQSGQAAAADLAADGTFKLAAFQGKNQVAVVCLGPEEPSSQPKGRPGLSGGKSLIPDRYVDSSTSGLTFEVKPGENNNAEFVLND